MLALALLCAMRAGEHFEHGSILGAGGEEIPGTLAPVV